jgi:hypothetical protein
LNGPQRNDSRTARHPYFWDDRGVTDADEKWAGRAAAFADSYAHLCAYTAPALLEAAGLAPGVRLLDVSHGCGHRPPGRDPAR